MWNSFFRFINNCNLFHTTNEGKTYYGLKKLKNITSSKYFTSLITLLIFYIFSSFQSEAQNILLDSEPLSAGEAFQIDYILKSPTEAVIRWKIKDFYYLYKEKIKFNSKDFFVEEIKLPEPQTLEDPFFGKSEVYYNLLEVKVLLKPKNQKKTEGYIDVTYQGCWEGGVCYPAEKISLNLSPL